MHRLRPPRAAGRHPAARRPRARVVILTSSAASLPARAAQRRLRAPDARRAAGPARGAGRAARALRRAHAAVRGRTPPERRAARPRPGGRAVPVALAEAGRRRAVGRARRCGSSPAPSSSRRSSWSCSGVLRERLRPVPALRRSRPPPPSASRRETMLEQLAGQLTALAATRGVAAIRTTTSSPSSSSSVMRGASRSGVCSELLEDLLQVARASCRRAGARAG